MNSYMQKRGQVTLFIIIGIVIVLLVAGFLAFKGNLLKSEWEKAQAESLAIPDEAQEVHDHVSGCVEELVEEPVNLLGMQGGYITLPEDPVPSSAYNPFSNSLEIFEGSGMRSAYWFYEAANGIQYDQMPLKEEMELEMAEYINNNLASCTSNFSLFQEYNVSVGDVYTEVEILDDKVLFTVDYPVRIELEEWVFDFPYFYESVDVPLGRMYEAAVTIQMQENEDYYLENMAYDVLVLDEDVPLSEQNLDCDAETWEVDEVESALKTSLQNNIQFIKVGGLDYSISDETVENYYEWNVLGGGFNDLSGNVLYYTSWPFEMSVFPNDDGTLESNSVSQSGVVGAMLKSLFCLSDYQFIYDVQFPVLISLSDKETGYVFQFATMVILDNNQPRVNTIETDDFVDVEDEICDDVVTPMTVYAFSVADDGSLIEESDAKISFECITYSCDMGETVSGSLYTMFPACYNANIVANKDGFVEGTEIISTLEEGSVSVILEREVNLTYDIKAVDADGTTRSLDSDETVYINLFEQDSGYSVTVYYPESDGTVSLIPGTYEVEGVMMQDGGFDINIPAQSLQSCTTTSVLGLGGIFGGESCVDVDMSEYELDSVLSGGVDLVWEPNRYELYDATHVTFYVTAPVSVESEDDVEDAYAAYETAMGMVEPELE